MGRIAYVIAGTAGAVCLAGLAWFLLKRKYRRAATSHVAVERDDEKIEDELSQLDSLAASVTAIGAKEAGAPGESAGKERKAEKTKERKEEKGPGKEENEAESALKGKKAEESPSPEKKGGTSPEETEDVAEVESEVGWTAEETEKHRALKEMIAKANLLLSRKESKKAYVLYLKIRREYDNLPKRIQMKIHEEFNGVRNDINRTIPELEIIDDIEKGNGGKSEKDMEASFLGLLEKTDAALGRGEKELAFILYSEIKGMYHLVPAGIKKEVYQRCVSIYKRCVGGGG